MGIGLSRERRRAVSLADAAQADSDRCPACAEPLFAWIETGASSSSRTAVVKVPATTWTVMFPPGPV